jgi:hypothetical protein
MDADKRGPATQNGSISQKETIVKKHLVAGCFLSIGMVAGCASEGRYQMGDAFADPRYENVMVIPVLDTQTGRMHLLSPENTQQRRDWRYDAVVPPPGPTE